MTLVKICGIREEKEALAAIKYGAWAIGEVFAPSRRRIGVENAAAINYSLQGRIIKIGVFVNEDIKELHYIARSCFLDMVQLHGDESPEYAAEVKYPVIKAFQVEKMMTWEDVKGFKAYAYLFDTPAPDKRGGSGQVFDWELIAGFRGRGNIILAGGLSQDNVKEAILRVRPMAVDVSSGVEFPDGGKDPEKIKAFMEKVKEADRDVS